MKFIHFNISNLHSEELIAIYGEIIKEFKESASRIASGYYVLFMIRRYILIICFHLLREHPVAQVTIISLSCWLVVIYLAIYKPYIDQNTNFIQILVEMCVAIAYTVPGFLINDKLEQKTAGWMIFISVNLSYIIQLIPMLLNVIKKIYFKIKGRRQIHDNTSTSIKNQRSVIIPSHNLIDVNNTVKSEKKKIYDLNGLFFSSQKKPSIK